MATKIVTRIAASVAIIGIVGLPLISTAPANAINKPEPGRYAPADSVPFVADNNGNLELTQIGAGTLGGIAVTGAAFAATARLRRHQPFGNKTPTAS